MKSISPSLILVALLLGLVFCPAAYSAPTIHISAGKWAPWSGPKLPHKGFVLHVVEEAFKNVGYHVKYHFFPWKRAYAMVANGKVQASAYWYESKKRKEKCLYSDKLTEEKYVFFYLKDNPMQEWNDLHDLQQYTIGASNGHTYTDQFWQLSKQGILNVDVANNELLNFKKLVTGRIDIFPSTLIQGYELLRKNFSAQDLSKIKTHPKPLTTTSGHLLFPKSKKDSPKLLHEFNQGLTQLKASGKYAQYLQDAVQGKYSR